MSPIKVGCIYWPPPCKKPQPGGGHPDGAIHPSLAAGMEALEDYHHWVNAVVLPIAFQWIEEHKPEVYANVPAELKDDVGVAIAAAFKLVQELPAYKNGREKYEANEASQENGSWDASKINPVWTGIVKKLRAGTQEAFAEHASLLGETAPSGE